MKSPENLDTNHMEASKNKQQNPEQAAPRETRAALPTYEAANYEQLWGQVIRAASKLCKEKSDFAQKRESMPEEQKAVAIKAFAQQEVALQERARAVPGFSALRTRVGLSAWAGEFKGSDADVPRTLFGAESVRLIENARILSHFSGYRLPSYRARKEMNLTYSKALLEAHRSFLAKLESLNGDSLSEDQREELIGASLADGEISKFLWSTKETGIYDAMVQEDLPAEVASEAELGQEMSVAGAMAEEEEGRLREESPRTEAERSILIQTLEAERDRLWEKARREERMKDAAATLQEVVQLSKKIRTAKEMPLGVPSGRGGEIDEGAERAIDDFMDRIGEMTPEEFREGIERIKTGVPTKHDTAEDKTKAVVSVLLGKAKATMEEAERIQPSTRFAEKTSPREKIRALKQLLRQLYIQKRAIALQDMADAIAAGRKWIYEKDEDGKDKKSAAMAEVEESIAKARKRKMKAEEEQRQQREARAEKAKAEERFLESEE